MLTVTAQYHEKQLKQAVFSAQVRLLRDLDAKVILNAKREPKQVIIGNKVIENEDYAKELYILNGGK